MLLTSHEQAIVAWMRSTQAAHPDKNITGFVLDLCAGKYGYAPEQVVEEYRSYLGYTGQEGAVNGL